MLLHLDPGTLLFAIVLLALFAFFFGAALNAIMGEDGFGPLGNTLLLMVGFFAGNYLARHFGWRIDDLQMAAVFGLTGAFLLVTGLALAKAAVTRF